MPAKGNRFSTGHILLIARQPVEGLRNDDVELVLSSVFEQGLVGWAQRAGAAYGAIGIGVQVLPTLLLDASTAKVDLVRNRRLTLQVAAVSGVDYRTHVVAPRVGV